MRTIKFRGKAHGRWIYGGLVYSDNIEPAIYFEVGNKVYKRIDWAYVDPATVGQFTGMLDKNGREIYEGDIVRSTICTEFVYEVAYNDERFASFGLRRKQDAFMHYFGEAIEADECEVIGNVFDNPELLKKGVSNESDN